MPPQENIDALQCAALRFKVKDLDGHLAMYSNTVIHHGFSSRIRPGVTGLKDHYTHLLKAFPDMRIEIEDIIAQGEKVVHRFTFYGTHRGDFLGFAATGKLVTAPGIHINLFADGKCIEVRSVLDTFRFLPKLAPYPSFVIFGERRPVALLIRRFLEGELRWLPRNSRIVTEHSTSRAKPKERKARCFLFHRAFSNSRL